VLALFYRAGCGRSSLVAAVRCTKIRGVKPVIGKQDAAGLRIALVASRYNDMVTTRLIAGARAALKQHGAAEEDVFEFSVPGAWELPLAAKALVTSGRFDAIVCLGCVIRGETTHHQHVGGEAIRGLAQLSLETGLPIGLGVLTTENLEQALARAGGKAGDKGAEAVMAAVEMANLLRDIRAQGQKR